MELVNSFTSDPTWLLVGVIGFIIFFLLRRLWQWQGKNALKQKERERTLQAAHVADRTDKSLLQTSTHQKSKIIPPQTRVPLHDPFGIPFTGAIQGHAAKWEAEIHKIGRQIIGQIDTKMAALQAMTQDANRTANRLEILVEHLEQITRSQIEWQQSQLEQYHRAKNAETLSNEEPSAVIPATLPAPDAAPLGDMLQELDEGIKNIRTTIRRSSSFITEQPESATILRLAELQLEIPSSGSSAHIRGEVAMLANYGLQPQDIAQRLNISLGEVDLMLQVQQNRLDRTL